MCNTTANSTIINCIIGMKIKEWFLKNTSWKYDLIVRLMLENEKQLKIE